MTQDYFGRGDYRRCFVCGADRHFSLMHMLARKLWSCRAGHRVR